MRWLHRAVCSLEVTAQMEKGVTQLTTPFLYYFLYECAHMPEATAQVPGAF